MIDWAALVARVELRHHTPPMSVRHEVDMAGRANLVFTLDVRHRDTGAPLRIDRSTWPAPPLASEDVALRHLFACLSAALGHELAEAFHLDGLRVFEPHGARWP